MSEEFHNLTAVFNKAINDTDVLMQAAVLKNQTEENTKIEATENAKIKNIKNPTVAQQARTQLRLDSEQRIHVALKQAKFAWQFKVAPAGMTLLDVKSDHGMTVKQWLEINYPNIAIIEDTNGFAG